MAEAKRDENSITITLGYDEINNTPIEIAIDPLTNRILAEVIAVSPDTPPVSPVTFPRDENGIPVGGVYNETDNIVEPLYIDADNGGIRADVIIEN
jgi:hypothetical protein